jgi:hypothetical protein
VKRYVASLRGSQEVPRVRTNASGSFSARLSSDGRKLHYTLVIRNICNATEGHIHLGARGVNGPVVAFLFGPCRPITTKRKVITGTITRDNLVGPLKGQPLSALLRQMRLGNTYVNVHTTQNPNGEIRGQVRRRICECTCRYG